MHFLRQTNLARRCRKELLVIEWFVTCQTSVTTQFEDCACRRFQVFAIL